MNVAASRSVEVQTDDEKPADTNCGVARHVGDADVDTSPWQLEAMTSREVTESTGATLMELSGEKNELQQELSETSAQLHGALADCEELRGVIVQLRGELEEKTNSLQQSHDREDDLERAADAAQTELRHSEKKWHEVVNNKEQLLLELRSDLEALTGSVQRREHIWDSARHSMEQQIETLRVNLCQQVSQQDQAVQVIHCLSIISASSYWLNNR